MVQFDGRAAVDCHENVTKIQQHLKRDQTWNNLWKNKRHIEKYIFVYEQ